MSSLAYLLDTNILSSLISDQHGPVMRRIVASGEETVCTSIVVAVEIRYGAEKRGSSKLAAKTEAILDNIEILPLDMDADRHYGNIRSVLEKQGETIGPNVLLIAAHARSLGVIVITDNTREYRRVPDLAVENWLLPTTTSPSIPGWTSASSWRSPTSTSPNSAAALILSLI